MILCEIIVYVFWWQKKNVRETVQQLEGVVVGLTHVSWSLQHDRLLQSVWRGTSTIVARFVDPSPNVKNITPFGMEKCRISVRVQKFVLHQDPFRTHD
jgi:hypothetical protein